MKGISLLCKITIYLSWFQDGFGLRNLFGGFISDFFAGRTVKHAEEIVVRASHDGSIIAIPTALKLIKDAIVFVQRAQLGSQILMNLKANEFSSKLH